MEEKQEYNLRGLGVLTLCMLLFAAGIWRFGGGTAPVNGMAGQEKQNVNSRGTEQKQVSLNFEGTWEDEEMKEILELMKKYEAKIIFNGADYKN